VLVLCFFVSGAAGAAVPTTPETKAFNVAKSSFDFNAYKEAEVELAQFVQTFTNSPLIPEAVLYQAEARLKLTNDDGALSLLQTHQAEAGRWADEYLFWQGEAHLQKGERFPAEPGQSNYLAAAELFAKLRSQFPSSPRCLEAVIEEAEARRELSDWQSMVSLLKQPDGLYQAFSRTNPGSELSLRGALLLGEAELELKDYDDAEAALDVMHVVALNPSMEWQRQYLLSRIDLDERQYQVALEDATNLLLLAAATGQRKLQAQSFSFQAGLLEKLGRTAEAIATYTNNLTASVPEALQREALLRITSLCLATNGVAEALQGLTDFVELHSNAPAVDLALLTIGELKLRQALTAPGANSAAPAPAPVKTNAFEEAILPLQSLTTTFPHSPLSGKAHLDLGWCYWLQTNLDLASNHFQSAVSRLAKLPVSADLATAYFKLADTQFELTNYFPGTLDNALANYSAVVALRDQSNSFSSADWGVLETNLLERALYQTVNAGLKAGRLAAATNAAALLLDWYPNGFHTDRAVLLAGLNLTNHPGEARALFLELESKTTNSPLRPKVQLAIARTYLYENKWDQAIQEYGHWLNIYTNHEDRPVAEFYRAWANYEAGRETNALNLFTNLVAKYPTNDITPRAKFWIADYYYRAGSFLEAEKNYQLLFSRDTNVSSEISYQAQMMAGRAAVQRQAWADATNYFSKIFSNPKCEQDLRYQALFAYGDILMSLEQTGPDKLADLKNALDTFDAVGNSTNRLAALAWGEKALCYFQYQPPQFAQATNELQKIIDSPAPIIDATARIIARVGLATILKKQAEQASPAEKTKLLEAALAQYRKVLTQADAPENPRALYWSWVKRAGLEAAPLAEDLHEWAQASIIYKQLQDLLPALRDSLNEKQIHAEEKQKSDASQ
jgi:TolA-binding protein